MDENEKKWDILPSYEKCFVCGKENNFGLRLVFESDGNIVRTEWIPRDEHCGYSGIVHGGVISAVLDEIMGWSGWEKYKKLYWTLKITVRFNKPIVAGEKYFVEAELIKTRGKVYFSEGRITSSSGVTVAEGEGKYIVRDDIETSI